MGLTYRNIRHTGTTTALIVGKVLAVFVHTYYCERVLRFLRRSAFSVHPRNSLQQTVSLPPAVSSFGSITTSSLLASPSSG